MKKTVYLFGAGINYGLKNYVPNNNTAYSPPLAKNFFKMCLSQWNYISNRNHAPISHHVFDYIKKYWNLSVDDLKVKDFDLEECFTLIQLQKKDLEEKYNKSPNSITQADINTYENLDYIEFHLARLLIEYLQSFDSAIDPGMMNLNIDTNTNFVSSGTSYIYGESQDISNNIEGKRPFFDLGKRIIEQNATVITFNYDLLIERVLMRLFEYERNSKPDFVRSFEAHKYWRRRIFKRGEHFSDEVFLNPNVNWKPSLAYGFDFDLIELVDPMNNFAYGQDYYELHKDKEVSIKILKPHGSLNWGWIFVDENESILEEQTLLTNTGEKKLTLYNPSKYYMIFDSLPLIRTPVLYKNYDEYPFKAIWEQCYQALRTCDEVIIGGYSFAPTDFYTKKMFLEVFSERKPCEVSLINPDASIKKIVSQLCRISEDKINHYNDLNDFLTGNKISC